MILYNFCELVTSHAVVKTSKNTKHVYKINFATAVNICRAYLKHGGDETETMLLIQKYLTPVRYNRKYPISVQREIGISRIGLHKSRYHYTAL